MQETVWILAAIAPVLLIAAIAWKRRARRAASGIPEHYGPEYERVLQRLDALRLSEPEAEDHEEFVGKVLIRPLTQDETHCYLELWRLQQARFVEDPRAAVVDAEHLIEEVMRARGYPIGQFEQQAMDWPVSQFRVVSQYQNGHAAATRQWYGYAGTEELRRTLLQYRALFEDLLKPEPVAYERRAFA